MVCHRAHLVMKKRVAASRSTARLPPRSQTLVLAGLEHLSQTARIQHAVAPGFQLGEIGALNTGDCVGGQFAKTTGEQAQQQTGFAFLLPLLPTLLQARLQAFLLAALLVLLRPLVKAFRQGHFQLLQVTHLGQGQGVFALPQQHGANPDGKCAIWRRAARGLN